MQHFIVLNIKLDEMLEKMKFGIIYVNFHNMWLHIHFFPLLIERAPPLPDFVLSYAVPDQQYYLLDAKR